MVSLAKKTLGNSDNVRATHFNIYVGMNATELKNNLGIVL